MKTKWIMLYTVLLFVMFLGCKAKTYECYELNSKITINGNNADWEKIPQLYDEDNETVFAFAKNDSFVFVMISFNNESMVHKFTMGGGGIWWSADGKKEEAFGLFYPPVTPVAMGEQGRRPQMERNLNTNQSRPGETRGGGMMQDVPWNLITPRFVNNTTGQEKSWSEEPFVATAGAQDKTGVCFEFKIPSSKISENGIDLAAKEFYVGLEISGVVMKSKDRPEGGPGGGMGGPLRGGMGGGSGGGPGVSRVSDMSKDTKEWFKLINIIFQSKAN